MGIADEGLAEGSDEPGTAEDEASLVGTGTTAVVPLAEEDSTAPEDSAAEDSAAPEDWVAEDSAAEDSEAEEVLDGVGWLWLWLWLSPLEAGALPDWLSEDEGTAGDPELLDEGPAGEAELLDDEPVGVAAELSDEVAEGAGAPLEPDSEPDTLWDCDCD